MSKTVSKGVYAFKAQSACSFMLPLNDKTGLECLINTGYSGVEVGG